MVLQIAWIRYRPAAGGGLPAVWTGLAIFMALRTAFGLGRFLSYSGPFAALAPSAAEERDDAGLCDE